MNQPLKESSPRSGLPFAIAPLPLHVPFHFGIPEDGPSPHGYPSNLPADPAMMLHWMKTLLNAQMPGSFGMPKPLICPPQPQTQTPPAVPNASPFLQEQFEWPVTIPPQQQTVHLQDESDHLRRFRQAMCDRNLDPQAIKAYQNFRYAMRANHPRRKNTSRETTGLLKAWLNEHRKNPYPNKSEKIMLAVVTKMSLTQVSTWFANARRRLKKENKATWSMALEQALPELDEPFLDTSGAESFNGTGFHRSVLPSPTDMQNLAALEFQTNALDRSASRNPSPEKKLPGKIWSIAEMTDEK